MIDVMTVDLLSDTGSRLDMEILDNDGNVIDRRQELEITDYTHYRDYIL